MRGTDSGILPLNPDINETERSLRKVVRIAKERTNQTEIFPIQVSSSDVLEMGDENPHIT